jgi:hypothetical protein
VGRSDLILEFFVYSEKEPKRRKEKSGVKMDDDKAVMEHHLKDLRLLNYPSTLVIYPFRLLFPFKKVCVVL